MANYSDIKYQAAGSATAIYADMAALIAATGMSAGDQALVTALNKVFMYTGTAWYLVATMTNASPTAITGVSGSYNLATDGTATTITAVSTDPEGFALTWSYAVTTGSLGSTATVSQADNVFTITPSSTPADGGSFSITFSVTDGATGAVNAVSAFTLSFSVTNSRYTALSVKATATGSNQTFDDASTSNHTITAGGNVTASTFSPHRHGGYSLRFENSATDDNNIKFDNTTGSGAVAASGEFCVETWVKFTVTVPPAGAFNPRIFASNGSGGNAADNFQILVAYSGANTGSLILYNNAIIYEASSSPEVINDGEWHHLAVTRDSSNNLRYFVDGSLIATIASNTTTFQFEQTRLGKRDSGTGQSCYTGDMRDTRVVIGSSVYESAFTPPTEPLTAIANTYLLVGDLPYIKDESTNNFSIHAGTYNNGSNVLLPKKVPLSLFDNAAYSEASHGASAYFDGTGDYLDLNGDAEFAFGTNDFTIEFWYYTNGSQTGNFCDFRPTSTQGTYTLLYVNSDNTIRYFHQSGDRITSSAISHNVWTHLALTRSGTDVKLFINGQQEGSTFTNSLSQLVGANRPRLGSSGYYSAGATHFNGYMSDIRILNGTAAYTSNFTPPVAPLTAITYTKFLLNPETSISDLSQGNALKCIGNAATSTTQVKFAGTKSIYLDGTGDYITATEDDASFSFGTGDFTVECWLYHQNASALYYDLVGTASNANYIGANRGGWIFGYYHTHSSTYALKFGYQYNNAFPDDISFSKTLNADTWYHLAMTRQGNQLKCFADGIQVGSTVTNSTNIISTEPLTIGTGATVTSQYVTGYMQDIRVTKGLARYTSNFTPPTAELEG